MRAIGVLGTMLETGAIYSAASPIFDMITEKFSRNDPLAAMEEILSDFADGKFLCRTGGDAFNTYPANDFADGEIFPRFLGVASGMALLPDACDGMSDWASRADRKWPGEEKIAVLITDKWDAEDFAPYEQSFRYLAMNKNFWFILLLATKYGCTEIPFLPLELYRFTRNGG